MSYQVLARKYRPRNFEEMVGQEHVLRALVNALDQDRLHQAYLFTGTRGVGKTTVARIFAKCLNCETGITSKPCGTCSACLEITEGRSVDLIEVDAASRTRVEDTRDLLDNVQYMPTHGRFKIYLIDEVHMLSNHSFNALLKTLEEPPEHVKFLLATTAPKRLPATVLSRCLQFNLKNMSPEHIVINLKHILESEEVGFEEPALWRLARAADGSMRDALSLTDQAISFGNNQVIESDVRSMLGTMEQGEVQHLLDALVEGDAGALLDQVAAIAEFSPDYTLLLSDLQSLLHRIAVAQAVPESLDNSRGDEEYLRTMVERISPEQIQLFYQIGLIGQRDLPLAPDARSGFEMVLLRMVAFRPDESSAMSDGGEQRRTGGRNAQEQRGRATGAAKPESPRGRLKASVAAAEAETGPQASQSAAVAVQQHAGEPAPMQAEENRKTRKQEKPRPVETPAAPEESAQLKPSLSASTWIELQPNLPLKGVTATLAANCALVRTDAGSVLFQLREEHASLWNKAHETRIADALTDHFGGPVAVKIEIGGDEIETPAQRQAAERDEQQAKAEEAIRQDRNVQTLVEEFEGTVARESIAPRR